MHFREDLRKSLMRIDGKGYKSYKDIEGAYDYVDFMLFVDHVQGDPFASPSRVRLPTGFKLTVTAPVFVVACFSHIGAPVVYAVIAGASVAVTVSVPVAAI